MSEDTLVVRLRKAADAIKAWREDDQSGYGTAIEVASEAEPLLREAADAFVKVRAHTSYLPGWRPYSTLCEVDDCPTPDLCRSIGCQAIYARKSAEAEAAAGDPDITVGAPQLVRLGVPAISRNDP